MYCVIGSSDPGGSKQTRPIYFTWILESVLQFRRGRSATVTTSWAARSAGVLV